MSWTWRFERADGTPIEPADEATPEFPAQSDAETWLGECWRDLLSQDVEQVTLLDAGREVYGPMSLREPE